MHSASRWTRLAGLGAVALATLGCMGEDPTVRPFIKRSGNPATDKTPEKTASEKTAAEKTPVDSGKTKKTDGTEKTDGKT